ncbi:MAG: ABC transporter permease subunit [bacterium]|nr:ABC transporter permease subunit [bacterium]
MERTSKSRITDRLYIVLRLVTVLTIVCMFVPSINPARVSKLVSKTMSFFTSATSYSGLAEGFARATTKGWAQESTVRIIFGSSLIAFIGIAVIALATCFSVGELKFKRLGLILSTAASVVSGISMFGLVIAYQQLQGSSKPAKVEPMFHSGFFIFLGLILIILVLNIILFCLLPKPEKNEKYYMESKYKLFLMFMPFVVMIFVFSYLPLWGWRYAFFDYKAGGTLSMDTFVGFKWFKYLFNNQATRLDIVRVLRNTLVMSGLGIATSWVAMAFAIFINEMGSSRVRRIVQTLTTIPNFISWVLVYAVALAIFSSDGFVSSIFSPAGDGATGTNYLLSGSFTWLKMLAWGMWKGTGWGAIIYIAAISGIDQQLYEAAKVDGAGRFQRMWHITVPGLMPTYCVLLLLSIAGILTNGLDQYLVFKNANNMSTIEVLDLYVFQLGINKGIIPLSTVIGMVKSLVSVILLFSANRISKAVRGESIV